MKQIKGILFDFNGTLFFDSDLHIKAFQAVFPLIGAPKPSVDYLIEKVFGRPNSLIYEGNVTENSVMGSAEEFAEKRKAIYYELCLADKQRFKLVDGAQELLDHLKAEGLPFTIATGSDREELEFFFEHLELDRWFDKDKIVYTDGTFNGKPYPDCYVLAAKKLGLSSDECLIFEDGTSGIMAANAANAAGVVVIYDSMLPSPLKEGLSADFVYHDLTAWRDILSHYKTVR